MSDSYPESQPLRMHREAGANTKPAAGIVRRLLPSLAIATGLAVTGGLAGDAQRFKRTWVLLDDGPVAGVVSAVGFYGAALRIGHGARGGWDIFGPERTVTKSKANVAQLLDGRPSLGHGEVGQMTRLLAAARRDHR